MYVFKSKNKCLASPITFPGKRSWILRKTLERLKKQSFSFISQLENGKEVKMSIYPKFRESEIWIKHLKIADKIDFSYGIFFAVALFR